MGMKAKKVKRCRVEHCDRKVFKRRPFCADCVKWIQIMPELFAGLLDSMKLENSELRPDVVELAAEFVLEMKTFMHKMKTEKLSLNLEAIRDLAGDPEEAAQRITKSILEGQFKDMKERYLERLKELTDTPEEGEESDDQHAETAPASEDD